MKEIKNLFLVFSFLAAIAFAAGCSSDSDKKTDNGDEETIETADGDGMEDESAVEETDAVEEAVEITEEIVEETAEENVEETTEETTEDDNVENVEDADNVDNNEQAEEEKEKPASCTPNPCDGVDDPYLIECVSAVKKDVDWKCVCEAGYDIVSFQSASGTVDLCEPLAGACNEENVTVAAFDGSGKYEDVSSTKEKKNAVIIDPADADAACSDVPYLMLGSDKAYKVELKAGEYIAVKVTVSAGSPKFDPSVYVVKACDGRAKCAKGADAGAEGEAEELSYVAAADETIYVIVDSSYSCASTENANTMDYCKGDYSISIAKGVGDACHPNPCDGGTDKYRTACALDSAAAEGYVCGCIEGYELITAQTSSGAVEICWIKEQACSADFTVEFDADGAFSAANDTTGGTNKAMLYMVDHAAICGSAKWQMLAPDHVYAVELKSNEILSVEVMVDASTPDYDPAVYILDACSTRGYCKGGTDDGSEGDAEKFEFEPEADGVYFLIVDSGYSPEGEYAAYAFGKYSLNLFKTVKTPCVPDAEIEQLPFNGNYSLGAGGQNIMTSCNGKTYSGQNNAFKIALKKDAPIQIDVDVADPDSPLDYSINVLAAACETAGANSACIGGVNAFGAGADESYVFTPAEDGDYIIVVDTTITTPVKAPIPSADFAILVQDYVPIACQTNDQTLPFIVNGDTSTAQNVLKLPCNDGYSVGPQDVYSFNLTKDQKIEAILTPAEGANLFAMLLKADGCVVNNPGTCEFAKTSFVYTVPEDGTYFLIVGSLDKTAGQYSLKVENFVQRACSADYNVTSIPYNDSGDTTDAPKLFDSYLCAYSYLPGRERIYSVVFEADKIYDIVVTPDDGSGFNPAIIVLKACYENDPESNACEALGDNASTNEDETLRFMPETTGEYFIIIDGGETGGEYDIEITEFVPVICEADQTITALPFEGTVDTATMPESRYSVGPCLDYDFEGRETVFTIEVKAGEYLKFEAIPDEEGQLDLGLSVLERCFSNDYPSGVCVGGIDDGMDGETESISLLFEKDGVYFVVVDTYTDEDITGKFTLKITSLADSKGAGEECGADIECKTSETNGVCAVYEADYFDMNYCSKQCETADDCPEFVSGCCIDNACAIASACGEDGATAQAGEPCAFSGININLPACKPRADNIEVTCIGSVEAQNSLCTMRCTVGDDSICQTELSGGCCVDLGFFYSDPWCVPAEYCQAP